MRCDRHQSERATQTITLTNGAHLSFCSHHARDMIEALVRQGKQFNVTQLEHQTNDG